MKLPHLIAVSAALLVVSLGFAQMQTPADAPCLQATSVSLAKADAIAPQKPLLGLNNRSWIKEGSDGWDQCVPLIEFDLSSIPPKSRIASAVLKLSFYGRGKTEMRPTIKIYPITAGWSSKETRWDNKPSWDENFTEIEVPPQPNSSADSWEIDVTPLVQKWVDGDIENHGLAIVADSTKGDCHNFAFYDLSAGPGRAPTLKITTGDGHAK